MKITTSIDDFATYLAENGDLKDKFIIWNNPNDLFDINKIKKTMGYSQISNQQKSFINSCTMPEKVTALRGNFLQISYKLSEFDSKDFFLSKDGKLLYDNDPIWSQMYINDLSQDLDWSKINKFRNVCATGGILSFSHFCGRNLLAILLITNFLLKGWKIVLPYPCKWIRNLLSFYSRSEYFDDSLNMKDYFKESSISKRVFYYEDSILVEEIPIWAQLIILKRESSKLCARKFKADSSIGLNKLYLSRDYYENQNNKVSRIFNYQHIAKYLHQKEYTIIYPEMTPINNLAKYIHQSKKVVCSPGSAYMNYILFSNSESKIIQMTPLVNLTESNKEIRKLIIQWFIPIMGELIFWTSSVQPCELDRYKDDEFVGNNSEIYDENSVSTDLLC